MVGMVKRTRERRDMQYPLRLTKEERHLFEVAAKHVGLKLAAWIRTTCLAAARRVAREQAEHER